MFLRFPLPPGEGGAYAPGQGTNTPDIKVENHA